MDAARFLLDTLSHAIRNPDGPQPGVPSHVPDGFETRLATLSVDQRVAPFVSRSLHELALPPDVSRVTGARLERHAEVVEAESARRLRLLRRVIERLDESGVPALIMGDALAACTGLHAPGARAVDSLELLINEGDTVTALDALSAIGFAHPGPHAVLGRRPAPPDLSAQLMRFHHYLAPLVLVNASGDWLRLRYRSVDVGHPQQNERAWDRAVDVDLDGRAARGLCLEDQLLDAIVRLGISEFSSMLDIADIGAIVHGYRGGIDYGHVIARARPNGLFAIVHHTIQRVAAQLRIAEPSLPERPPRFYDEWYRVIWRPDSVDYAAEPRRRNERFLYGLIACGGPLSKLRWVWRHFTAKPQWVETRHGDASNPFNWIRFFVTVRQEPAWLLPRAVARASRGNKITPIDRGDA